MPVRSLLDAGVHVVFGTDAGGNIVFHRLHLLVTRRAPDGVVYNPEERVDGMTALLMATRWGADYVLKSDVLGSIEVGKWADLVVPRPRLQHRSGGRDLRSATRYDPRGRQDRLQRELRHAGRVRKKSRSHPAQSELPTVPCRRGQSAGSGARGRQGGVMKTEIRRDTDHLHRTQPQDQTALRPDMNARFYFADGLVIVCGSDHCWSPVGAKVVTRVELDSAEPPHRTGSAGHWPSVPDLIAQHTEKEKTS